jgi:membrane protease YdiL (CAAX protease family)
MTVLAALALICLMLSLLSPWVQKNGGLWGCFLALSLALGWLARLLSPEAVGLALAWIFVWVLYVRQRSGGLRNLLFALIVASSFGFRLHLFPGYMPVCITPQFCMGFETALVGLLPLALCVPLYRRSEDRGSLIGGLLLGILGIAVLACLAVWVHAVEWHFKLPSHPFLRYANNLFFACIPEEAFYRGFLQKQLHIYLGEGRGRGFFSVFITSLLFTLAHVYWSPSMDILGFVFLASLLYGFVYMKSGRIESAIFTHFVLNFTHMTFFSYHAM